MTQRDEKLRRYLEMLTPSGELDELVQSEASGAEAAAFTGERRDVLEKLALRRDLTDREQVFVEAIIIPDRRPAVNVVNGTYQIQHADWLALNGAEPRGRIEAALPSIGRVELPGHPTAPYGGTAFVVGPDLLMTNRHVAEIFSQGLGDRGLRFTAGRHAAIDFLREFGSTQSQMLDVSAIVMIHPYWDMALLRVEGLSAMHAPLRLSLDDVEDLSGREVAVIGYPTFDPRNPSDVQNRVFGGIYGVKRLQPGKLLNRFRTKSYGQTVSPPTHDASTLGGNSGSCVVDVATGEVVGLHFAGRYLERNWCVAAGDLARDERVIDAGVTFGGRPAPEPVPWSGAWDDADRLRPAEAPARAEDSADDDRDAGSADIGAGSTGAGEASFTIPLTVSIRLGDTAHISADISERQRRGRRDERPPRGKPFWDPDYSTRQGYDPDFLGRSAPMPKPRQPDEMLTVPGGGKELKYHHFSLIMHRERRIAALSAANVDGSGEAKSPGNRPFGDYTRDGLAGRSSDAWFLDERIDAGAQFAEVFFEKDRGSFDKGHVVRRDDVAWGDTYQEMRNANGDSFHVTNCAPQVAAFNRSTLGSDNWGDLEDLILEEAEEEKLQVFGGPVFKEDDPVFTGRDHAGRVSVKIPHRYWKLIVARKGQKLQSFGFVLEQDLKDVSFEFAVPSRWRRFTVPVSEIEDLSNFEFSSAIRNGDQFDGMESVRLTRAGIVPRPAGSALPAAAAVPAAGAALADIEGILSEWRAAQSAKVSDAEDARFVVELNAPLSDETIAEVLRRHFQLELNVGPLFAPDLELDRFRAVAFSGLGETDRADLFDVARAMRSLLGAGSVEPDLDSRYFDGDPEVPRTGTSESGNFAFWCWADEDQKPADPDWAHKKVRLPEAWRRSEQAGRPPRGIGSVIFQPDTGVVTNHPDVPAAIADDPRAANFVERGEKPIDPMTGSGNLGHGTATGSVAASPLSGKVRGAAPEADLVPVRCLRSVVRFNQSLIAEAVDHARREGAHVITMSLGGVPSLSLRAACKKAVRENVIVMAAAGNCVGTVVWPARYQDVVAVGGVNHLDRRWQGSSRGSSVDISAPAEFVLRADARDPAEPDKAGGGQGTSFAVAMLSGVAACWLAHHGRDALIAGLAPGETLQDLFRRHLASSARVPPGFDTSNLGAGVVDADALIALDPAQAGAPEAVAMRAPERLEDQIRELFAEVFGEDGAEAAAPAMRDPVSQLELACVGLDAARYRRSGSLEAQPPQALSRGLKREAGRFAEQLMRGDL